MKSALGILLLLTAQVQAIPITHEFTGAISDVDVVGLDDFGITRDSAFSLPLTYDTSARDQLEQTDLGLYAASGFTLSGDGLASAGGPFDVSVQDTIVEDQSDQLRTDNPTGSHPNRAKQKVLPVPDFGGTALLLLLSSGLLIAIHHRRSHRSVWL